MRVLLAIKPEYALKIFNGTKKFEFRKSIFKNNNINRIVVYVSSPIKKVLGEFEIDSILESNPEELWAITKYNAGITKEYFDRYFENKQKAYAIKIKQVHRYESPQLLKKDYNIDYAPQSYIYLDK